MIIYKYLNMYYLAHSTIDGKWYGAAGRTHYEALSNCLKQIYESNK